MRQALSDVRVVELGTGVAASWCGKAFADIGADVVKVEPPGAILSAPTLASSLTWGRTSAASSLHRM